MSKSKKSKDPDDDLTAKQWQALDGAACAIVARKYCDIFAFWHDCHYKPCRSARRCIGDARHCLDQREADVPHEIGIAADQRVSAETPPNADRFLWSAHHRVRQALGKRNPKLPDSRAKNQAKNQPKNETRNQTKSE